MKVRGDCQIPGCDHQHEARGFCHMHYQRFLRHGNPYVGGRPSEQTRFWRKVQLSQGCWRWLGAVAGDYGRFMVADRRLVQAHRYAYQTLVGPIPNGLTIDHLCSNKLCVNPSHMEPVTAIENHRRYYQARTEDLAKPPIGARV